MEENLTVRSFIVRVYRADKEDTRKITALVEALDGSDRQEPFRDIGELAAVFSHMARTSRKKMRKANLYLRLQDNIKTIRTHDNSLVYLERQLIAAYRQEEEARAQEEQDILSTRVQNRIGDMAQGYQNLSETGRLRNEAKKLPYNDQIKKIAKFLSI